MTRLPQTVIVLALLASTATAFAVTERLKLEKSPITGTRVDKIFSPVCECERNVAVVSFRLRKPERVTVDMLNSRGKSVATRPRPSAVPRAGNEIPNPIRSMSDVLSQGHDDRHDNVATAAAGI